MELTGIGIPSDSATGSMPLRCATPNIGHSRYYLMAILLRLLSLWLLFEGLDDEEGTRRRLIS